MEIDTMSAYDIGKVLGYVVTPILLIIAWRVWRRFHIPPVIDNTDRTSNSGFWYFMGHNDGMNDAQD